jgi:hypothetical protein
MFNMGGWRPVEIRAPCLVAGMKAGKDLYNVDGKLFTFYSVIWVGIATSI